MCSLPVTLYTLRLLSCQGFFALTSRLHPPLFFFCCSFALFGGALLLDTAGDVVEVQVMQRDFLFFLCVYFFLFQMVDYDFVLTSSVLQAIRWRPANLFCTAANLFCTAANLFCTADHSWHSTWRPRPLFPAARWVEKRCCLTYVPMCDIVCIYMYIYVYMLCIYKYI